MSGLICLLALVSGCASQPYTLTFEMSPDSVASVTATGHRPLVRVVNHGPGAVVVQAYDRRDDAVGEPSSLTGAEGVERENDDSIRVTFETRSKAAEVTCVVEGATGCALSPATPKK